MGVVDIQKKKVKKRGSTKGWAALFYLKASK
jgi:hypothetical protein